MLRLKHSLTSDEWDIATKDTCRLCDGRVLPRLQPHRRRLGHRIRLERTALGNFPGIHGGGHLPERLGQAREDRVSVEYIH